MWIRIIATMFMLLWGSLAHATLELELTRGISATIPIGVMPFYGSEAQGQEISEVIAHDLSLSGRFKIKGETYELVDRDRWKSLGLSYLVQGDIRVTGDQYHITVKLIDTAKPNAPTIYSHQYTTDSRHIRSSAHRMSDGIYEYITGQRGFFNTKIAYVTAKRYSYYKGRYTLNVADYDGYRSKPILISTQPIMSPAWGPDGRTLAYVSFENHKAQIFSEDIYTGARRLISSFEGINSAPSWSPDGRRIALVLSKSGYPKIYVYDLITHQLTQATQGTSLDTEPSWAPDGRHLLFTSDRGGSPQIYQVDLASKSVQRISYHGKYNAKASYSPDGRRMVMLHNDGSGFYIAVLDLHSGQLKVLTQTGYEESPSWAPNGELVMYATGTAAHGTLGIVSVDGRLSWRLPEQTGPVQEPAWSPFLKSYN